MKKMISFIVMAVMVIGLIGCGSNDQVHFVKVHGYNFYFPSNLEFVTNTNNSITYKIKDYRGETPDNSIVLFVYNDNPEYTADQIEEHGSTILPDGMNVDYSFTNARRMKIGDADVITYEVGAGSGSRFVYLNDKDREIMMIIMVNTWGYGYDYMRELDNLFKRIEKTT